MSKKIEGQILAGIVLIEINNPARLNSPDLGMVKALTSLIKSAESLERCKMIIIYMEAAWLYLQFHDIDRFITGPIGFLYWQ